MMWLNNKSLMGFESVVWLPDPPETTFTPEEFVELFSEKINESQVFYNREPGVREGAK